MIAESDRLDNLGFDLDDCSYLLSPAGGSAGSPRPLNETVKATALKSQARRQGSRSPINRSKSELEPVDLGWASFHRGDSVDLLDRRWAESSASSRKAKPTLMASQVDVSWLHTNNDKALTDNLPAATNDELMEYFKKQTALVSFFREHDPEKQLQVDKMLEAYQENPEALYKALQKRYGKHPLNAKAKKGLNKKAVTAAMLLLPGGFVVGIPVLLALSLKEYLDSKKDLTMHRKTVEWIYAKHNPSKLGDVPRIMQYYRGKEAELYTQLASKYAFNLADELLQLEAEKVFAAKKSEVDGRGRRRGGSCSNASTEDELKQVCVCLSLLHYEMLCTNSPIFLI
jgi:hypothetical protein